MIFIKKEKNTKKNCFIKEKTVQVLLMCFLSWRDIYLGTSKYTYWERSTFILHVVCSFLYSHYLYINSMEFWCFGLFIAFTLYFKLKYKYCWTFFLHFICTMPFLSFTLDICTQPQDKVERMKDFGFYCRWKYQNPN